MFMKIPQKNNKINYKDKQISIIALDVRSSENVGSFFRTGDAMGINHIYLVGYTPTPLDKFNRPDSKIAKTALGAEKSIQYSHYKTITPLINKLKKDGCTILALEQDEKSIDYRKIIPQLGSSTSKLALIVGNEVTGIPKNVLNKVDYIIEIPMRGIKESLNVSVATGIAVAELTRDVK